MDQFAALGIDSATTPEDAKTAETKDSSRAPQNTVARPNAPSPWISLAFALAGAATYGLLQLGLLSWTEWVIFFFILGAGPLAFVGLIFGIISAVRMVRPLWLSFIGILLSVCALGYIALEFLHLLAQIAFA
jgi:hypothetical protein